jgi:hypothetical protein
MIIRSSSFDLNFHDKNENFRLLAVSIPNDHDLITRINLEKLVPPRCIYFIQTNYTISPYL